MNIASSKLDQLAERLARLTGENVETALERAVEEKLARVETAPSAVRRTALQNFFDRVSQLPVLDARSPDNIVGCD
jgi:antitoxin VapB